VDEMFVRYLDNSASGFSVYSGEDQHLSYAFDREGWRYYAQDPNDPCHAVPAEGVKTTPDPVPGLDTNDELAFMASDAGPAAPSGGGGGGPARPGGPPQCTQQNGDPVTRPGEANAAGDTNAFWECPQRRRPSDGASVTTQRYRFRYDGRWLMTDVRISPHDD